MNQTHFATSNRASASNLGVRLHTQVAQASRTLVSERETEIETESNERQSGEYPAFVQAPAQSSDIRSSKLRLSLLRAIHSGYEVYLALATDDIDGIHRRGRKSQSFRKLAVTSQMAVSTLWRALATYLLYRRHPEIAEYGRLGVGHISVVLSVEEEYQLYFLRNAEIGRWSRRRLNDEVKFYHAYRAQHGRLRAGIPLSA
jgi:hypothetical protein